MLAKIYTSMYFYDFVNKNKIVKKNLNNLNYKINKMIFNRKLLKVIQCLLILIIIIIILIIIIIIIIMMLNPRNSLRF